MPDRRKCIAIGVAAAWLMMISVCIAISIMMLCVDLPDLILDVIAIAVLSLACYVSAHISTQLHRRNGLIQGLICGLSIFLGAFILSVIFNGLIFTPMLGVKLFACTGFGIVGGIKGINSRKTNKP